LSANIATNAHVFAKIHFFGFKALPLKNYINFTFQNKKSVFLLPFENLIWDWK